MNRTELLEFLRRHQLCVEATASSTGVPRASLVGYVVNDQLELYFDTQDSTRKYGHLKSNPKVALVIGWDQGQSVQYEGIADFPTGAELERWQKLFVARFPEVATQSWPGLVHVRVRPTWIRYSDYRSGPPKIVELEAAQLR